MLIFIFPIVVDFVAVGSAVGAGHSVTVQPDGGLLVDLHPWGHLPSYSALLAASSFLDVSTAVASC